MGWWGACDEVWGLTASYRVLPGHRADGYPAVSGLLIGHLAERFPPAVAIGVGTSSGGLYSAAGGWARLADPGFPEPVPADADTLFDLASLTKVIVTLPLVLLLHQTGQWSIDDPVARWLPGAPPSPVTISQCLLHASGLVPHRPFHETCAGPAEIKRAVIAELAGAVPGPVSYSDLGFMLLGWAVEDGNAFALGGVSGHAGLFGTAGDLGRFASALLTPARDPVLSVSTLELMTSRRAGAGAQERALGWRLRPEAWGDWPDGTIWHTGFTGTSLLIAPVLDLAVVLLSNAVHPVRRPDQIGAFRAGIHRAVRAAVRLACRFSPFVQPSGRETASCTLSRMASSSRSWPGRSRRRPERSAPAVP